MWEIMEFPVFYNVLCHLWLFTQCGLPFKRYLVKLYVFKLEVIMVKSLSPS